jgi:hypothetical protein
MKKLLAFLILSVMALNAKAQEFNAQFKVSTPKLQNTDPKVFRDLEEDARQFINTRTWTNDKYENTERIKCNFLLTIKEELSTNSFKADLTIAASRPVFGSNYETPLINYIDKEITFTYEPNRPLNYVQNSFTDNFTAILAFYLNVIIGLDYDSFAANGGNDFYLIAQNIVNQIPANANAPGWRSSESNRNRYWMIESILSPRLRPMRSAWYQYHRLGLDIMHQNPEEGKLMIMKSMETIDIAKRNYPVAVWIQLFSDAKSNELVEIFKKADKPQQQSIFNILSRLDPSAALKYQSIFQ